MSQVSATRGPGRVCAMTASLAIVALVVLSLGLGLLPRAGRAAQKLDAPAPPVKMPDVITVSKGDAQGRILITGELRAARYREVLAPRTRALSLRDVQALEAVLQPRLLIAAKRMVKTFQGVSENGRTDSRVLGVGSRYPEIHKPSLPRSLPPDRLRFPSV